MVDGISLEAVLERAQQYSLHVVMSYETFSSQNCNRFRVDRHPEYNAHFARLADSLNPMQMKRKALLSVHPCDFLEMSNRNNSWCSCHCLDCGEYTTGEITEVHGRNGEIECICQTCPEDHYYYCEGCVGYFLESDGFDTQDGFRCNDCLDEDYGICYEGDVL